MLTSPVRMSGPYREKLDRATANQGARFTGFRTRKKLPLTCCAAQCTTTCSGTNKEFQLDRGNLRGRSPLRHTINICGKGTGRKRYEQARHCDKK